MPRDKLTFPAAVLINSPRVRYQLAGISRLNVCVMRTERRTLLKGGKGASRGPRARRRLRSPRAGTTNARGSAAWCAAPRPAASQFSTADCCAHTSRTSFGAEFPLILQILLARAVVPSTVARVCLLRAGQWCNTPKPCAYHTWITPFLDTLAYSRHLDDFIN